MEEIMSPNHMEN